MKIDLHTHTYFSDGSLSPTEVVNLALERGVKILAISDHDVTIGVKEAISSARGKDIVIIPGIEIDTRVTCSTDTVHIVGLYVDINNSDLNKLSDSVIKLKRYKTEKRLIVVNNHFKTNITYEDLMKETKGDPGRAHIGRILFGKGCVKSVHEGVQCTGKGGVCYISFEDKIIHAKDAIKIIHDAGGLAVLAHLAVYKYENKFKTFEEQEKLISELTSYDLDGLEIYIPDASEKEIKFGKAMAKDFNLKVSGGSDFHDEKFIPQNKLGFLDIAKSEVTILKK